MKAGDEMELENGITRSLVLEGWMLHNWLTKRKLGTIFQIRGSAGEIKTMVHGMKYVDLFRMRNFLHLFEQQTSNIRHNIYGKVFVSPKNCFQSYDVLQI